MSYFVADIFHFPAKVILLGHLKYKNSQKYVIFGHQTDVVRNGAVSSDMLFFLPISD